MMSEILDFRKVDGERCLCKVDALVDTDVVVQDLMVHRGRIAWQPIHTTRSSQFCHMQADGDRMLADCVYLA